MCIRGGVIFSNKDDQVPGYAFGSLYLKTIPPPSGQNNTPNEEIREIQTS